MKVLLDLHVNGKRQTLNVDPATPLLYVLRNQLELNGPKYGCGMQQCGACMVLIDGKAQPSCMLPVASATKFEIVTLEGLANDKGELHPVQQAFVDEQAAQCGYCLNGMVINAVSILNEKRELKSDEIKIAMQRSLCRCGTYSRILKAVEKAAATYNK